MLVSNSTIVFFLFLFYLKIALLSGTLRTFQKTTCDSERVSLSCPRGTSISIELAQYEKNGIGLYWTHLLSPAGNRIEWERKIMQFIINLDLTNCSLAHTLTLSFIPLILLDCHWIFFGNCIWISIHTQTWLNSETNKWNQISKIHRKDQRKGKRKSVTKVISWLH